jgi:hypothetical protein
MSFLIPHTRQPAVDTALPTDREEAAAAQAHG